MRVYLETLLGQEKEIHLLPSARNTFEARSEMLRDRPDWVLLDELLPGESSFDLIQSIAEQGIGILLMSGMEGRQNEATPLGVHARLAKPSWEGVGGDPKAFKDAVLAALQGRKKGN